MTFQSTFIPCNTYIITRNFQWPSEHKHLANIRWSLDFSGHENSRQKSALNSWQACGGLRVAEGSNRYTKDSWISCHIWRDLCSVIICSCWPSIQSLNWDPAWGRRGMRGGGGGSTWMFILRSNTAQGHTESAKMVAAQREAGEATDWWVPVSVVADKVPTRQS